MVFDSQRSNHHNNGRSTPKGLIVQSKQKNVPE